MEMNNDYPFALLLPCEQRKGDGIYCISNVAIFSIRIICFFENFPVRKIDVDVIQQPSATRSFTK